MCLCVCACTCVHVRVPQHECRDQRPLWGGCIWNPGGLSGFQMLCPLSHLAGPPTTYSLKTWWHLLPMKAFLLHVNYKASQTSRDLLCSLISKASPALLRLLSLYLSCTLLYWSTPGGGAQGPAILNFIHIVFHLKEKMLCFQHIVIPSQYFLN